MADFALGWRAPEDRTHEQAYSLERMGAPATAVPVVIGIPWYSGFDRPMRDAVAFDVYWIGKGELGSVRGGHAVCLRPPTMTDPKASWVHYNQGREGACVGFATSRAATLFNNKLYNGLNLYNKAKTRDPWPGENYSGTSVNAGLNTLRLDGAWPVKAGVTVGPVKADGILSYAWAKSASEVAAALKSDEGFVRVLNSWGKGYPAEVRMPLEVLDRLLKEGGEAGVPIDRPGASAVKR